MQLTEKVRRKILDEIIAGKYGLGDKIPTEREMAETTGTSRITVRRAYAQLERAGIILRRPSAGTCVSSAFKGNPDEIGQIAVIATLRDPFASEFIEEVNRCCREADILNILSIAEMESRSQAEMAASLAAKGIRNIIVWGFDKRFDLATFERLRILGINMVFFDRVVPGPYADHVGLDNADAAKTLLQAASSDGLREALVVNFSDLEVDSNRERQESFLEQCAKLGVPCKILAIPYAEDASGCSEVLARIPKKGEGLGVFFINDQLALKLKPQFPAGAKLYSVDGTPKALASGIASYSQPMRAMAAACVEALRTQQRLGQKWQARRLKFKGSLLRRQA